MTQRPDYIYQGGSVVMHSPLQLKQAEMYGYFLKGQLEKLQLTVDNSLNAAAAGNLSFKVLSPYVLTTFTRVNHANSSAAVDYNKGWITEIDIVTWIMVGKLDTQGKLEHIYYYPAHIFVDDAMALINGRELFGYPKYTCEYEIPEQGTEPTRCSISAKGFQPFSPDTKIALLPLLEVNATQRLNPDKPIHNFLEFLAEAFKILSTLPDFLDWDKQAWAEIFSMLSNPRIEQIFLKQFPDSAGEKAVYQAILSAPANIDQIHSGSILGYEYQATLHSFDSFPLNETLGLALGNSPAILPFNLNFDFTVVAGEELYNNSTIKPEKIAILGGGVGSMTTAYYLTNRTGWQNDYEITVYQMGWRLGGKGASGRNPEYGERIEEHGLHIWFGFYENAFAMIKEAYAELNRPANTPLAKWDDAFKPHDFISVTEHINGEWLPWNLSFPHLPGEPGIGSEDLTIWQMGIAVFAWVKQWIETIDNAHLNQKTSAELNCKPEHHNWLAALANEVDHDFNTLVGDIHKTSEAIHQWLTDLDQLNNKPSLTQRGLIAAAVRGLRQWLNDLINDVLDNNTELRRLFICADLGITIFIGMLEDGVFDHGFNVINDLDFRAWLIKHGANQTYSVDAAPVRGFYDLVFAYIDGDFNKPDIEAGTILRAMLKIAFCYKGSIMYKMQAGMGDTIFTPMYQALKQRGVKFKFFHKVEELIPTGNTISEIRMTQQVSINDGIDHYNPFVVVKDLDCWPSYPNYEQINPAQAALLKANNINLESNWTNWPEVYQQTFGQALPQISLKKGIDFDRVVFGISVAAISDLCPQLLTQSESLRTMCNNVKTVVTQAYQVWLNQDLTQMGWTEQPNGEEPVLSGFTEPYDTWAPMDQLLCREDWPAAYEPKNVSYFCSAMPMPNFPPYSDHAFPARSKEQAKQGAINQLSQEISALWPNAGGADNFKWAWLIDQQNRSGEARFDAQYWRANVDPSERYVLSVTNSSQYRLDSDESGFDNLYLTGDWLRTGLNAGCVEAAVMSGMQASRAMIGYPKKIKGEEDLV